MKDSKSNKVPAMIAPFALGDSSISEVLATVNGIPAMPAAVPTEAATQTVVTEEPLDLEDSPAPPPAAQDTVELD